MKSLNQTRSKLFFILVIAAAILQSCLGEKPGTYINDKIDAGDRKDFHDLNSQVLISLKSGNIDSLGFVLSKDLIGVGSTARQVELISNQMKTNTFELLDEYYVVRDTVKADSAVKIPSPKKDKNAYRLSFTATPGENYIALFLQKSGDNKQLITIEYYKYDYGWKVSNLGMGNYSINGKTALEYYEFAEAEFAKNYLVNTIDALQLARACAHPSELWQYALDTNMENRLGEVVNKANTIYKYPIILEQVATHPRIFSIASREIMDGTYPSICYLSSIKLQDSVGIKKENEAVKKVIGTLIPGIDKDKKYLIYSVYNQMPSAVKSVDRTDIADKIQ